MDTRSQADRLQDITAGVFLIVAGLLMLPTTYFEYSESTLFPAGAGGYFLFALLLPGLLGVARLLRSGSPRLAVIVSMLICFGCVAGAAFETAILHEWAARSAGTPEPLMTEILRVTEERVFPVMVILGGMFPISLLTLGVGLFQTNAVPRVIAVLVAVGAVMFPIGHIGSLQYVSHVAETVLLIPFVWIGAQLITGSAGVTGDDRPVGGRIESESAQLI